MHPQQQNQLQKTMNAVIVTGDYIDKTTGAKKKKYNTIGSLFIYSDGSMSLKLDAYPTRGQNIVFYDIKPKQQSQPNQNNQQNKANRNFSSSAPASNFQQNQQPQQNQQGYNPNQPPPQNHNNSNGGYQ